jgi:hypothetical protein
MGLGTGFFSFEDPASFEYNTRKKVIFTPVVSYYHKSGLGISVTGYIIKENQRLNSYQYAVSPSYDYVTNKNFSAGLSFTRYYTQSKLSFYTTPIQNEVYAYVNYKKWWLQPGLAVSYGWGNKTEFQEREVEVYLKRLKQSRTHVIYIRQNESIKDLSMLLSVRHNFEWDKILSKKDMLTVTPALLLSGGTQNFGFNTSFSGSSKFISNFLPSNRNITDVLGFDVQSATFLLRMNYSRGRYYMMPQILLDYYLHQSDKRFNSVYSITAGYTF